MKIIILGILLLGSICIQAAECDKSFMISQTKAEFQADVDRYKELQEEPGAQVLMAQYLELETILANATVWHHGVNVATPENFDAAVGVVSQMQDLESANVLLALRRHINVVESHGMECVIYGK